MKKSDKNGVTHVTAADGNVFADLGFSKTEATRLQARSRAIIQTRLQMREALASEIVGWIKDEDLLQEEAAKILNVSRPRVSDLVRKKVSKFSLERVSNSWSRPRLSA
jgi:predicted XRE-type DNA-binding protein